jgi:hypothetical protein
MHRRAKRMTAIAAAVASGGGAFAAARLPAGGGDAPAGASAWPVTTSAPVAASANPPRKSSARMALDHPADAHPVIWVRRGRQVEIRTAPGGGDLVDRAGKRTEFGSPTVFGVVRRSGEWAGVSTQLRPNGRLGWIRLDRRRLGAGWTRISVVIDLSERRAELRRGPAAVRAFAVTVGAPGTETPTGRFAVTDTLRGGLNPAYGCCALALSATQPNTPSGWLGGRRIAIHGTSEPLGIAASLGCVRAADADVAKLVSRVPLGTPVFIRG